PALGTSVPSLSLCLFFFFTAAATTQIYTLSLHDALPISSAATLQSISGGRAVLGIGRGDSALAYLGFAPAKLAMFQRVLQDLQQDRKSTRLNSSHLVISYAVFCLKKKNNYNSSNLHTPTN